MKDLRGSLERHTGLFLATLDRLTDDEMSGPSRLPGWRRTHLVAHVHHNAEALRRLVGWAATGTEQRMYDSPEQRVAEIEAGSERPVAELRSLVHGSAEALAADLDSLTEATWHHEVVTAQGRTVPATEIPWLRLREVAVHAVDLDAGTTFDDLEPDFHAALAAEVLQRRVASGEGAVLSAYLTGRGPAPDLGPWL